MRVISFSAITSLSIFLFGCEVAENQNSDTKTNHEDITADVLIAGGGTSGITAGLQAARDGAETVIVEPTPWLGGMLTSAGVSATDGNHQLPSGIWGEFRQHLYDHYGGPDEVETGWVSNTLFEPSVGNDIWNRMAEVEDLLTVYHGYYVEEAHTANNRVTGAMFKSGDGERLTVEAGISIDATEYGDLMALSGTEYHLGFDSREDTGEELAPHYDNEIVQDLTYTAILKDYGEGEDKTIERPANYYPQMFTGACKEVAEDPDEFDGVDCEEMLDYARLPNDKFLINWPIHGNDYYLEAMELDHHERKLAYEAAKDKTRQFIYFIQTEIGFSHLGLADDEYDTDDLFPHMPYHRESRRLEGVVQFNMMDMKDMYQRPLYKTAIAVGDYPLDHHRRLNPGTEKLAEGDIPPYEFETDIFPSIPSYAIPYGAMVPAQTDGLLVAEKSLSVTSIANGATRLQPVVMGIGQAAGAAAALAATSGYQPRDVNPRELQSNLIEQGAWMLPFLDSTPDDWHFEYLQKTGLSGVLKGEGIPVEWANETRIYPDSSVTADVMDEAMLTVGEEISTSGNEFVTRGEAVELLAAFIEDTETDGIEFEDVDPDTDLYGYLNRFDGAGLLEYWAESDRFYPDEPLARKELAYLIHAIFDPFEENPGLNPEE